MRLTQEELEARTHSGECLECGGYYPICNICEKCMRGAYGNGRGSCHKNCKIDAEVVKRLALKSGYKEGGFGDILTSAHGLQRYKLKRNVMMYEIKVRDKWKLITTFAYSKMQVNREGEVITEDGELIVAYGDKIL